MSSVQTGRGLRGDYLCIDNLQNERRVYVHKMPSGYVITKSPQKGIGCFIQVRGQEFFDTIQELNNAIN